MGDFNTHLGTLGGLRVMVVTPTLKESLYIHGFLQRCDLFVTSLSDNATGPDYTFGEKILTPQLIMCWWMWMQLHVILLYARGGLSEHLRSSSYLGHS